MSNLDKLDDYFKLKEGQGLDLKFFQQDEKQQSTKKIQDQPISYLNHMKYANESTEENNLSEKSKILGDMSKIEKIEIPEEIIEEKIVLDEDMKTINEYFKSENSKIIAGNNKYKNLCEKTKVILNEDLSAIKEVDSMDFINKHLLHTLEQNKVKKPTTEYIDLLQESATHFFTDKDLKKIEEIKKNENEAINEEMNSLDENIIEEEEYANEFEEEVEEIKEDKLIKLDEEVQKPRGIEKTNNIKDEINEQNKENAGCKLNSQFSEKPATNTSINEDIVEVEYTVPTKDQQVFESGAMESNYIIDIKDADKLTSYLLKTCEIYDDDYLYSQLRISHKRYIQPPDPHNIYEFCANVMIMTKMEKEVIIICLIYVERFIFNTGILMNARNWKRLLFTAMVIASKVKYG
jgi:hypothetical protein